MINSKAKIYCSEDVSLIENYDKAINDNTKMWVIHHKLEIELNLTCFELKQQNLYYKRPANELIFLTMEEHKKIHGKNKQPLKKRDYFGISEYNYITDFTDIKLLPLQAIKLKCKECCGYDWAEAKRCDIKTCPLNQFIAGKKTTYTISEEERERRRNNFKDINA